MCRVSREGLWLEVNGRLMGGIRLRDSGRHLPRSGDLCRNLGALLLVVGRTIILAGRLANQKSTITR
jgi:hypothetical protein